MFNLVILSGRLTSNVELKHTPNDVPVATFQIAVDRRVKAGEEKQADFIDCVAWRSTAEFISKYFGKGTLIGVEGTLNTRRYEDKDGNKRKAYKVTVSGAHFMQGKDAPSGDNEIVSANDSPFNQNPSQGNFTEVSDDGDLPF